MTVPKFTPSLDPSNYIFHEDAGHGWLEVPLEALRTLSIGKKISPYSYVHGDKAYLEEDRDAPIFMKAWNIYQATRGVELLYRNSEFKTVYDGRESPIRNYRRYEPGN
jgi:hypothetical protein